LSFNLNVLWSAGRIYEIDNKLRNQSLCRNLHHR
jgi:hypothetical protein